VHVYVYDLTMSHFQQKGPQTMIPIQYTAPCFYKRPFTLHTTPGISRINAVARRQENYFPNIFQMSMLEKKKTIIFLHYHKDVHL
jgi:hypothetical protein